MDVTPSPPIHILSYYYVCIYIYIYREREREGRVLGGGGHTYVFITLRMFRCYAMMVGGSSVAEVFVWDSVTSPCLTELF